MTTPKTILLVDDDDVLRGALAEQFQLLEGIETVESGDGKTGLEIARQRHFDLVLIDVGLPDMDGHDLCRMMRHAGVSSPIIMLTSRDSDADAVSGLDSGASDHMAKPFKLGVLLARVREQLRRITADEDAVFKLGPYVFRLADKMLVNKKTDTRIRLTEKEAAILKFLHRAGNTPVPRDRLLGEVWGYNSAVTTHTVET
ncbi:MAG: response regulator transcription factor, partial [Pseudomonadota bacterium]|nr:response regulator transcription factor [Pseudomonadota bacterium]